MKRHLLYSLSLFFLFFISCDKKIKKNTSSLNDDTIINDPKIDQLKSTYKFPVNFNPFPPKDLDSTASDSLLVKFAWEEFIALNWKSTFKENGKRDTPDQSWNWTQGDPELSVWETYAHRSELRPFDENMKPFDDKPHYSFGDALTPATSDTSFLLFNNLDENSEIGSCNLYAHSKKYGEDDMVLYQAKVNREEYDYIKTNYPTNSQLKAAQAAGKINLPAGGDLDKNGTARQGAMEIKTAWRLLVDGDTASDFFTRKVIYFRKVNGKVTYFNKVFALIGIHIIHKTKQRPDFVFATWEHVNVEKDDMAYVLLKDEKETGDLTKYSRYQPIPKLVQRANASVHQQISAKNSKSIWKNYRLVGVQGKPTNDTSSMSFYLANYVIESDPALAQFHGSSISNPFDKKTNTTLGTKKYSMGGCMGCHGVGQGKGVDFSFLLDQVGKPIQTPDLLEHIPADKVSKLDAYINAY